MTIQLIGIHGKASAGKDSIAAYITSKYLRCYTESFASPLKRACAEAFGIPEEDFYSSIRKEMKNSMWNISPRQIAQFVGTEMFRDTLQKLMPNIGSDFWIARLGLLLDGKIPSESGGIYDDEDTVLIPDVRFQNEYEYITANKGIIIHLTRPGADGKVGIQNHISEADIDLNCPQQTYLIHNDSTMEDLYAKVENVINLSKLELFYTEIIARNPF